MRPGKKYVLIMTKLAIYDVRPKKRKYNEKINKKKRVISARR